MYPLPPHSLTHHTIQEYGQKELGCNSITQPWLSYYIDGCEQRMHTDSWHGPFAYVFSLTNWETRQFTGGETFIMDTKVCVCCSVLQCCSVAVCFRPRTGSPVDSRAARRLLWMLRCVCVAVCCSVAVLHRCIGGVVQRCSGAVCFRSRTLSLANWRYWW